MIIGICGAGTMGRGIAIAAARAGHSAVMVDLSEDQLGVAASYVNKQLDKAVEKGKMSSEDAEAAKTRVSTSTDLKEFAPCDLVIEAIVERLDVKHQLLEQLEKIVRSDAIIATNTSSISIAAIARPLEDPTRFVGLHFFNPAHIMKLVEVIRGPRTSDATVKTCVNLAVEMGKSPVVARDVPGFIVNRVARNFYNEPQRIVGEQAATVPQIDTLMKGLGFRMGPFELMDLIGVDTNLDVTKSQWEQFFLEPRFAPSMLQQQTVDAGNHGKKSGRGFYDHSKD